MESILNKTENITINSDSNLLEILNYSKPFKVSNSLDGYVHKNILLREGSSLYFTDVKPTVVYKSPIDSLESIYELYIGQHE
jgi:hypothetical protein